MSEMYRCHSLGPRETKEMREDAELRGSCNIPPRTREASGDVLVMGHEDTDVCTLSHFHCVTFYDPLDCNPPGSSVHGILWARILEWVAISSSKGSS